MDVSLANVIVTNGHIASRIGDVNGLSRKQSHPRQEKFNALRSCIPPLGGHRVARAPNGLPEVPTMSPGSLIAKARLKSPPGNVPRSAIPPFRVQKRHESPRVRLSSPPLGPGC